MACMMDYMLDKEADGGRLTSLTRQVPCFELSNVGCIEIIRKSL